ncbi:MAG: hypothetical protein P5680_14095 [Limnospira sp. PMC 737.11]|uniref:Uncharacterized protein n=1 Tax=Limnospira fusiformis PMC 851.14 TaxID=2219512 RepID=A0ABU9EMH1_LIMFS|nr:hypothetical protein [Limnospira sp. PMC 737.11]MDT9275724.1 hypothetical protein [Limnospira sp. PMC 737.11]
MRLEFPSPDGGIGRVGQLSWKAKSTLAMVLIGFRPLTGELVGLDEESQWFTLKLDDTWEFPSPDGGIGRVGHYNDSKIPTRREKRGVSVP